MNYIRAGKMGFARCSEDVRELFVDQTNELIMNDNGRDWIRTNDLDDFAKSLVSFHHATVQMDELVSGDYAADQHLLGTEKEVDGCKVTYLGAKVIAQEIRENVIERDATINPVVLSRLDIRSIVNQTVELLDRGNSVFVIGQPGTCSCCKAV
jgi:hypothetical protein